MADRTILIVEYDPSSIERIRGVLEPAGYRVEVAHDGLAGIEAFHRLKPDLTLIEPLIPRKDGFEVCRELKATPHGKSTPILLVTGVYKRREHRLRALHFCGCDDYLEKPIADEALLAAVRKFLSGSGESARCGDEGVAASSE
jgi:two-component system phosphate regulon response regulator PhoB